MSERQVVSTRQDDNTFSCASEEKTCNFFDGMIND